MMNRRIGRLARVVFSACVGLAAMAARAGSTSLDYVQNGLVAHWDAIDNQGNAPHDNAATTWVDLVGGRTFTLYNTTFDATSLAFTGSTAEPYSYGELSAFDSTNTFLKALGGTVEYVFCYGRTKPAKSPVINETIFQCGATNGPAFCYSTSGQMWFLRNDPTGTEGVEASDFGATTVMTFAVKHASDGSVAVNTDNLVYVNGANRKTNGSGSIYGLGECGETSYIGIRSGMVRPYAGKLMAIRVYSRPLTAAEIAANAALDQQRFVNGEDDPVSSRLRVDAMPDQYGPAENYGDFALASGEGKPFEMPLPYIDPDSCAAYNCVGWCLYDISGNVIDSGSGNVCNYTHPNPAAYRRLVWIWKADAWPAGSGVRYVSTDGDDANTGLDWLHPYKTVQRGIDNAGANGAVLLAAGTHKSADTLMLTNNVSLVGCARQNTGAVLRLTATLDNTKNVLMVTNVLGSASAVSSVVTNLTLTNNKGGDGSGVELRGGLLTHCVIRDCTTRNISDNGGGINMTVGTVRDCLITGCNAKDSGGAGCKGGGVYMTGGLVENCRIVGNGRTYDAGVGSGGGVYMTGGTLRGCLVARNWKYAQGSGVNADGGVVENCTIADNTQSAANATAAGVYVKGAGTKFRNNILWGNTEYDGVTAKDWSCNNEVKAANVYNNDSPTAIAIGSNNISAYPNFLDGDYRTGYSVCVNAGSNQPWMEGAKDLDGGDRIVGGTVDIGCYEYVSSSDLECVFSYDIRESALDRARVAFTSSATGSGVRETMTYTWTFTRADGFVESVAGAQYATYEREFGPGTWDVRLDVDNGDGSTAYMETPKAFRVCASVVYVSKTGTGEYPCMTPETATNDIDVAFRLLGKGGTMYVDEGEYVITQTLRMDGTYGSRIIGKGPGLTAVRLGNVRSFTSDAYRGLELKQSAAYVEGLTVAGGKKGPHYSGSEYGTFGLSSLSASGATITNCVFRDAKSQSYGERFNGMGVNVSAGRVVDCRFENITAYGSGGAGVKGAAIYADGGVVDRVIVDRCAMTQTHTSDIWGDVVYASGASTVIKNARVTRCDTLKSMSVGVLNGATLLNCTVACNTNSAPVSGTTPSGTYYNNMTAGVGVGGSSTVKNCIVVDNWSVQCGCISNLTGAATYTLVNDRDASFATAENHNVVGEPAFVDAAAGDYHLVATASPAVNAGDWSALGETKEDVKAQCDLDGNTRLVGGVVDLGCYETALTPIAKPTAVTGLVYDGTLKTGLVEDACYERSGTYEATDAGTYTAYATPKRGYVWADDDSVEKVKVEWSVARAVYTWQGPSDGNWDNSENWESALGGFPDNKNKTVNFAAGNWCVNVNGTWTVYDIEFQAGATVTLTGTGAVKSQSPIGLNQRHHLLLEGERIDSSSIQVAQGQLSVIGLTSWPCYVTIYYGSPLAMRGCNLAMSQWDNLVFGTSAIAPLYATNTTVATTTKCDQITDFNFYLSGSTFCLTTTKSPTNSVSLVDSTMELTNATAAVGFKNVTVADGASHFTATGDYEPAPGGTWSFTVPAAGYATAPVQAANVAIPTGHKLVIDLTAVNTAGTYPLATATGTLSIDDGLSGLKDNATLTLATGMKTELILTDDDKTLAVEVKRNLSGCAATVADIEYTGGDLTSGIQVTVTGTFGTESVTLVRGTDYDVAFTPDAIGQEDTTVARTATITGRGAYEGQLVCNFNILGLVFVWVGDGTASHNGSWTNAACWNRVGSGPGHGWPGDNCTSSSNAGKHTAQFDSGAANITMDIPSGVYTWNNPKIKHLVMADDADVSITMGEGGASVSVEEATPGLVTGVLRIAGHSANRHFPFDLGGKNQVAYMPLVYNALHLTDVIGNPCESAFIFEKQGENSPLLTVTDSVINQGSYGNDFLCFECTNDTLAVRIAMTNSIWRSTCGKTDVVTVGRHATLSYCNSTNLAGIVANYYQGSFTIDNSVVGYQNLHGTNAKTHGYVTGEEGDTFLATSLAISGANTKFALSEKATVTGNILFTMPTGGFANDEDLLCYNETGKTAFSIDTSFSDTAPLAVVGDLDLKDATLTVNATDIAAAGTYPLARVSTGTLTPPAAAMTVKGVASGFIGWVKVTAGGKGLDLVIESASLGDVTWTVVNNYTNFWYTGKTGTYPRLRLVTPGGYELVEGTDYVLDGVYNSTKSGLICWTSAVVPVGGDYYIRAAGRDRYNGQTLYAAPFKVVWQTYEWTSSSGPGGAGAWLTGTWLMNTLPDVGNAADRPAYPTSVASVTLSPADGAAASVELGGTEAEPRTAFRVEVSAGRTAWLRDGVLKLYGNANDGEASGALQNHAALCFSNVTLLANASTRLKAWATSSTLVFAGDNWLPYENDTGVLPQFHSNYNPKTMRFENGTTAFGDILSFVGNHSGHTYVIVSNATVRMKRFDPGTSSGAALHFDFRLGDRNVPNDSSTVFTPLMAATNTFSLGTTGTRFATIDATAKTTRGEAFDILTVPTSFDLYEPFNGMTPFAPETLVTNTTCATGFAPQIAVVTNETTAMQTIRLRILEKVTLPTMASGLVYTGATQTGVTAVGDGCTLSGSTVETSAGSYQATGRLSDGYCWPDGTTDDKTFDWTIAKATITSFAIDKAWSVAYTGTDQTPGITGVTTANGKTFDTSATGWDVAYSAGEMKAPGAYTVTVTGKTNLQGEKTENFEIRAHYELTDGGVNVKVLGSWADAVGQALGKTGAALLTSSNDFGFKYWEVYAFGFETNAAKTAAAVVQPVQTSDATKLTLKLGDWPATPKADAGVTVKYKLMRSTTSPNGGHTQEGEAEPVPQFEADLTGWETNVRYYHITPVFENK